MNKIYITDAYTLLNNIKNFMLEKRNVDLYISLSNFFELIEIQKDILSEIMKNSKPECLESFMIDMRDINKILSNKNLLNDINNFILSDSVFYNVGKINNISLIIFDKYSAKIEKENSIPKTILDTIAFGICKEREGYDVNILTENTNIMALIETNNLRISYKDLT